jgi:lipid-binding SYLF domain-containing protein
MLLTTIVAIAGAARADESAERLGKAAKVLTTMTSAKHGIPGGKLSASDCIAVIPGFKKGAAVIGVGFGKGFISCRTAAGWSAPGAITVETGSFGAQVGGEEMDLVMLSLDKEKRPKLLSDRFAIGTDASAAWGNGKSAHEDPSAKIFFYGRTKGAFAGFGLDGATLKRDASANKTIYGRELSNVDVIEEGQAAPAEAGSFMAALPR